MRYYILAVSLLASSTQSGAYWGGHGDKTPALVSQCAEKAIALKLLPNTFKSLGHGEIQIGDRLVYTPDGKYDLQDGQRHLRTRNTSTWILEHHLKQNLVGKTSSQPTLGQVSFKDLSAKEQADFINECSLWAQYTKQKDLHKMMVEAPIKDETLLDSFNQAQRDAYRKRLAKQPQPKTPPPIAVIPGVDR